MTKEEFSNLSNLAVVRSNGGRKKGQVGIFDRNKTFNRAKILSDDNPAAFCWWSSSAKDAKASRARGLASTYTNIKYLSLYGDSVPEKVTKKLYLSPFTNKWV